MKKDIEIPEVKNVYVSAILELNAEFHTYDWNVYLINDSNDPMETVLIVSEGRKEDVVTSKMRHTLKLLPAKSYAKIEFLEDSVLVLNNYFMVTFFIGDTLYDKRFEFPAHSIIEDNAVPLPVFEKEGILAR